MTRTSRRREGGAPWQNAPVPDLPLPTAADVEAAAARLEGIAAVTPLQRSERLSAATGADVWLKREDLQPVRSYKLRGAYNLLAQVDPERLQHGAVCASAGNHGQGVALAGAQLGVRTRVYLPRTTPRQKRDRIAALGGELVEVHLVGDTYDEAAAAALVDVDRTGAVWVPAFDAPETVAGQGTVAREVVEQLGRPPDLLVVPCGGGGLLAGTLTWTAGARADHPGRRRRAGRCREHARGPGRRWAGAAGGARRVRRRRGRAPGRRPHPPRGSSGGRTGGGRRRGAAVHRDPRAVPDRGGHRRARRRAGQRGARRRRATSSPARASCASCPAATTT